MWEVGRYLGYTGRDADDGVKAARDQRLPVHRACFHGEFRRITGRGGTRRNKPHDISTRTVHPPGEPNAKGYQRQQFR